MGTFSIWHWLILTVLSLAILVPFAKILKRTGHSPLWVFLMFVPLLNWVGLWIFAFKKWDVDNS
ncbi:hypothetical protein BTM36_22080 [Herbaspirillum sp. VT-16-41]|nr:hypothetical protein BTM36_22080 [Herbaspirillum sp. VT-16-41]